MAGLFSKSKAPYIPPPPGRDDANAQAMAEKMRKRAAVAEEENATRAGTILGGTGPRPTATSSVARKTALGS